MPILTPMNMSLGTFCALNLIPGWGEILALPVPERIVKLRDPDVRAEMLRRADSKEAGVFRRLANFGRYVIGDTYSEENEGLTGRVVRDIAAERGQDPFQCLVEICADDELRTVLWPMPTDNDPASAGRCAPRPGSTRTSCSAAPTRARTWTGCAGRRTRPASSATVCAAAKLVALEEAVKMLTDDPARLFGLRERGRIAEGFHADLVLFDPERIDAGPATLVHDLPGRQPAAGLPGDRHRVRTRQRRRDDPRRRGDRRGARARCCARAATPRTVSTR